MTFTKPSIETRLTTAFGLRHPFACAGLAFAGDVDQMPLLAGQGVGMIHDLPSAGDVIETMMADAVERLRDLGLRTW